LTTTGTGIYRRQMSEDKISEEAKKKREKELEEEERKNRIKVQYNTKTAVFYWPKICKRQSIKLST
jgi:hypothetical protein